MKSINKNRNGSTLIAAFIATALLLADGCATGKSQAQLQAMAKVTKEQAQQTALTKAPGGTVKEAELEEEKGRLIWSLDIATPGTTEITEVHVDALTGEVVSLEKESASDQAKEKKSDKPDAK